MSDFLYYIIKVFVVLEVYFEENFKIRNVYYGINIVEKWFNFDYIINRIILYCFFFFLSLEDIFYFDVIFLDFSRCFLRFVGK